MLSGKLVTFDLAAQTGYAKGDPDALPSFATHNFVSTGDNFGRHQANAREWLSRILTIEKPTLVAYEQPSIFGTTTPATVIKLCSYASTLEEMCLRENFNIRIRQVNPATLKKFWTGNGKAKKPEMVAAAIKYGFRVQNDDEADALAMWFYMVECYGSEAQKARFHQMSWEAGMGRPQKEAF